MKNKKILVIAGAALAALILVVVIATAVIGKNQESTAAEPAASASPAASGTPEATGTPAAPSPSASTSPEAPAETELSAPPATPNALPEAVPGIVTGLQCNVAGGTQLFATLQDVWASPEAASDCDAVYGTGQVNAAEGAALAALDPNAQSPFGLTSLYAICASLDDTVLASVSTAYSPSHKTAALSLCPNHPKAALLQG